MGFRLALLGARKWDPDCLVAADIIFMWAEAIWLGDPKIEMLNVALAAAREKAATLEARRGMWTRARAVPDVLLRKLEDLTWHAVDARRWILHTGLEVDLCQISPAALRAMAVQAAGFASDVIAQQKALPPGAALPPVNWQETRRF